MTQPRFALAACADAADAWLFDTAVPLWLKHGVDWNRGGFYEALDLHTLENPADFKRLRVVTRQIYVFTQGARRGVSRSRDAVDHGLDFLFTHMRHPDGGFVSRCDLEGRIVDPTRDLYDHAFVLYALAHAYRLTGQDMLRTQATNLLGFIQAAMRHPARGYVEGLPAKPPRRQNPHMHLLEAALACAEYMPDPVFTHLCNELADLCEQRFLDREKGLLFEYYSDDLVPQRIGGRARVEPGHHMEWAWLLTELMRITGRSVSGGHAMVQFALCHGLDPATGLLRGELFDDGTVADASVRLWPHGEWLKAALAMGGDAGDPVAAWHALARFLQTDTPGLWLEQWDAAGGTFKATPSPASSLYHITTAVMELRHHADLQARA